MFHVNCKHKLIKIQLVGISWLEQHIQVQVCQCSNSPSHPYVLLEIPGVCFEG